MSENKMQVYLRNYTEDMGEINYPEGFEEQLKKYKVMPVDSYRNIIIGMNQIESCIINQMRCFGWSEIRDIPQWDDPDYYSETPSRNWREYIEPLAQNKDHIHLVMKDGLIAGVARESYLTFGNDVLVVDSYNILLPGQGYVYDSTSDNNGSGYKKREWYKYLVCLPQNHKLW